MSLYKQCYVACGVGDYEEYLSSVEMLRLGAQAWELIEIPDLTPRRIPIISQIDSQSIAILGGNKGLYVSNGVILNAKTATVIKVINPASDIKFTCESQSFMKTSGEIVSLVMTME